MSSEKGLYIIYCKDDLSGEMVENGKRFGGSAKRIANYVEHRAYLASTNDPNSPNYILKIAVGPLESEDLKYMIGSCCIVEATREEAERFNQNDPLYKNGVWKEVDIQRWISPTVGIKAVDPVMRNGERSTVRMVVREE